MSLKKKMKKIRILVLISILFFISSQNSVVARYYESILKINGRAIIAEPIIRVEALQDTIITEINKNSQIQEYAFVVKNYEIDSSNKKRINEVDFLYNIEIKNSNENFPIRYELYDCLTNEELLNNTSKSKEININKNVEFERKYKLLVYWNEIPNMSNHNDIEIIIKINQKNN